MFERFDEIFASCGWRTVELRYGKRLGARSRKYPALKAWLDDLPNADFAAMSFQGGAAWRARIDADLGKAGAAFLKAHDDDALGTLMTDLGGHCMATLVEAFDAAQDDVPTLFIAWTVKGFGLPFAGHKDNHSGLMNPTQAARHARRNGHIRRRRMAAAGRGRRQCPARGPGLARPQPHRARQARPLVRHRSKFPRSPRRPAPSKRLRPRSARSCSTSAAPAATLPTASSRPRPTSPFRPTSAHGSTSAACSSGAR